MAFLADNNEQEVDVLVVIPVKNESRYIAYCLKAVLSQEYKSFAVVVVDNGSSDNTMEIVRRMNGATLLEKKNGTIGSVRNFGAQSIASRYIAFLDGDCVPPPSWLQTGVELLQDEQVACIGFPASSPGPHDSWVAQTWHLMSSNAKYTTSCYVDWLSSFNLIVKRENFEKIGGFNEALKTCEDYDLGIRLNQDSHLLFSDILEVQHLGIVHSLKEFFQKELWRGKSNLQQLKTGKEGLRGILGVLVPLLYLVFTLFLFVLSFWRLNFFFLFLLVWVGVPLLFVCRKLKRNYLKRICDIRFLSKIIVLAAIYLYARGLALVLPK